MNINYYDALGIDKTASLKELRAAYRRLARKYHPDVNPQDDSSELKFKEINEAYQVLSDPDSRRKYDQFGENWKYADYLQKGKSAKSSYTWFNNLRSNRSKNNFRSMDFDDQILRRVFGESLNRDPDSRKQDIEMDVNITLEEAYQGVTKSLKIPASLRGKSIVDHLELKIPSGIGSEEKITYVNKSKYGSQRFIFKILIDQHKIFSLVGRNLKNEIPMSLSTAILGGEVIVPTITGKEIILTVPPLTQNGQIFKLKGKGMPYKSKPSEYGDQMIYVHVVLPQSMTNEQVQLFKQLGELT